MWPGNEANFSRELVASLIPRPPTCPVWPGNEANFSRELVASLIPRPPTCPVWPGNEANFSRELVASLIPRPSITANVVEGLVKLLLRMISGGRLKASTKRPPDIILCRSFTRPSTALAVIEGPGMRLTCGRIPQ